MAPDTQRETPIMPVFSAQEIATILAKHGDTILVPTAEQRIVIELAPVGSTLVVAGAGSGKTETLANRVVWLIANGICGPEHVLGLTFTVKAAGELNERIRLQLQTFARHAKQRASQLSTQQRDRLHNLEAELAGGLNLPQVSTYNSFASNIVTEFGPYAGIGAGATLLNQAAAEELALEVVQASQDPRLRELDNAIETIAKNVLNLEHEASEHLVSSLRRIERVTSVFKNVASLPYNDKNPTTEKQYAKIRDLVQKVHEKEIITDLAQKYRDAKTERSQIEFSDQVAFASQISASVSSVREVLNERYRVVLLDEVQDTSVGQTRLLSELFQGSAVMGVGDPHQSIYAWRGAAADALDSFHTHFAEPGELNNAQNLTLSTSWRNPHQVLAAANTVSGPLREQSIVDVPQLKASGHADTGSVTVNYFETQAEELQALATWIATQRSNREAAGLAPPTSTVLVRNKNSMAAIAEALTQAGVPSHIVGLGGLLNTPEVTDIVALLECVNGIDAENSLVRVLTGPRFRVGVRDLYRLGEIAKWLSKRDISQKLIDPNDLVEDQILPDPDRTVTNIDALDAIRTMPQNHSALRDLTNEGQHALREAAEMLHRLRRLRSGKIAELIRACEQELYLDIELAAHPQRQDTAVRGTTNNNSKVDPRANLDSLVTELTNAEKLLVNPTLASVLTWVRRAADVDDIEAATPPPSRHTVQILTVHKSKGLEWDVVAIPLMREGKFPSTERETSGWLTRERIPDSLRGDRASRPEFQWELASTQKELLDRFEEYKTERKDVYELEERRLAYVAITRSKQDLWMSGSFWGTQKRPLAPSHYLTEISAAGIGGSLPEESIHSENPDAQSSQTLQWPLPILGRREHTVQQAAASVREAIVGSKESETASKVPKEIELLIAEHNAHKNAKNRVLSPNPSSQTRVADGNSTGRVNASAFHSVIRDPEQAAKDSRRPIPQRPYRGTDIGNKFHDWVEQRYTTVRGSALQLTGLDEPFVDIEAEIDVTPPHEPDDDSRMVEGQMPRESTEVALHQDAVTLQQLQTTFEASRWADRQPVAVELEISVKFAGQRLICKLDAVFEQETEMGKRIEIVDWKTGRAPRNAQEESERFFQLDLYRHAYALWSGVQVSEIDAVLYYVSEDREVSKPLQHSLEDLEQMWLNAQL